MEPSDLNTHLPPRKRLLAGFRMAATACDAEPPSPPLPLPQTPSAIVSGDLAARLRQMMSSADLSSSPEEIIQAARSAASAAADAAVAARAAADEKATVAAKARAAARAAMEFLDSVSRSGASRNGIQLKLKSRKKHVKVKLLYKPNGRLEGNGAVGDASKPLRRKEVDEEGTRKLHRPMSSGGNGGGVGDASRPRRRKESDEEIARKLHRAMNSSPRISFTGPKMPRTGGGKERRPNENGGGADACNGSSAHVSVEVSGLTNGCSLGKSSEIPAPFSKNEDLDDDENFSRHAAKSRDVAGNGFGFGIGNLSAGRKVKIKRKELLLNQHHSKDIEEPREAQPSMHSIRYDESKSNGAEKRVSLADAKDSDDGLAPMKITSVWKFKKFKTSHCSSDSKMLRNVCPSTSAAESSASVKAD